MTKYLSIPVKNEANQLVLVNDIALVEQASTSQVDIHYTSGKKVEVAHDVMAANNEDVRDRIEENIIDVLTLSWTNPSIQVSFGGLTDAAGGAVEVTGLTFA